ncbi:MAG: mechanosensitive ion channel family protein [Bacteroidetes bacterium]|nr:MAG: mechanosensitive ion channel family protein [Bacteroidota bacterium]
MSSPFRWVCVLAGGMWLAACSADAPEPAAPEATRVDTAVFVSAPPDTAGAMPAVRYVRPPLVAVAPETPPASMPGAPDDSPERPDTSAVPVPTDAAAQIAALREEVARLSAAVAALAARSPDADSLAAARPDTVGPAAALDTGTRLRETAQDVRNIGLRTAWAVLVLVFFFLVVKGSVWILETLAERNAARRLFFKKLVPIVRLLIWIIAIYYVVAGVYQIDQQQLLAASAALGVAIGFAAQDVLKNIFGGIIIIFDQPFQVGDKIDVGGTYGEVVSIGLRSTRIVTPDDNLVSVPNAQVVDGQVSNANAGALDCQVVTHLYLPGWVDPARAKAIAYAAAASSKYVYLEKPIVVIVKDEFKETFLTHLIVKAYVLDTRYENALVSDVTEMAKAEFIKHGLLVPFTPPLIPEPANGRRGAGTPSERP